MDASDNSYLVIPPLPVAPYWEKVLMRSSIRSTLHLYIVLPPFIISMAEALKNIMSKIEDTPSIQFIISPKRGFFKHNCLASERKQNCFQLAKIYHKIILIIRKLLL